MGEVVELKKDSAGVVGSVGYWRGDDGKIPIDDDDTPCRFVVLRQKGRDYVIQFFWECERGNEPAGTRIITGEELFSDRVHLLTSNASWKACRDFWSDYDAQAQA